MDNKKERGLQHEGAAGIGLGNTYGVLESLVVTEHVLAPGGRLAGGAILDVGACSKGAARVRAQRLSSKAHARVGNESPMNRGDGFLTWCCHGRVRVRANVVAP
jgi:hypothetical protein